MSTDSYTAQGGGPLVEGVTIFDGMRVEVFDGERRPLFEASLEKISDRLAVLHRTSDVIQEETVEAMSADDEPTEVTARGFYAPQNIGVYIRGWLSPLPQGQSEQWMFQDVKVTGTDEGRTHYRTPLKASGWIAPIRDMEEQDTAEQGGRLALILNAQESEQEDEEAWIPCSVSNASTGGTRFRTEEALEVGDRVRIRFKLRRGKEQPPLTCEVCSAMERDGGYEYGCKFVDRTPETDDIIVRTIIELQIMQA